MQIPLGRRLPWRNLLPTYITAATLVPGYQSRRFRRRPLHDDHLGRVRFRRGARLDGVLRLLRRPHQVPSDRQRAGGPRDFPVLQNRGVLRHLMARALFRGLQVHGREGPLEKRTKAHPSAPPPPIPSHHAWLVARVLAGAWPRAREMHASNFAKAAALCLSNDGVKPRTSES